MISAYTAKATIIEDDPARPRQRLRPHFRPRDGGKAVRIKAPDKRDAGATTLEAAINLSAPRLLPAEAPTQLPNPASAAVNAADVVAAGAEAPLSANQTTMAALALACEMGITSPDYHAALASNHQKIVGQKDAADYIAKVEAEIEARRQAAAVK